VTSWASPDAGTLNSLTTKSSVCSAAARWVSARVRSATARRHCHRVATAPPNSVAQITPAAATAPALRRTNDDAR